MQDIIKAKIKKIDKNIKEKPLVKKKATPVKEVKKKEPPKPNEPLITKVNERFYEFSVVNLRGKNIALKSFKGKVLLIVNIGKKSKFSK